MKSVRAMSSKAKLFAAGVAVMAIALVAVLLPTAAGADQQASTSLLQNGGVLQLHLGAQDFVGFRAANGSGFAPSISQTQSIGVSSGCKLALTPASSLVTISSAANQASNPGFVSDSIGVRTNTEGNGQPCGRIDAPGQKLTVDLKLAGKVIDFAELDLELKFGGAVTVTGFIGNDQVGDPVTYTSAGSDSGPDSGDNDNYRVRFPKSGFTTVNRLVFSIDGSTGGASLEGGADGTQPCDITDAGECGPVGFSLGQTLATSDSLFHLIDADGFLNCGSTLSQTNDGITTSIQRLDNAGGGTCTAIPINQDSSQTCTGSFRQCTVFQKNLGDQEDAQFYWTVTWAPEPAPLPGDPGYYMESPTQFDFGNGPHGLQQCRADGLAGNGLDGFPDLPANGDPWCVVDTSTDLLVNAQSGVTFDQVTERYFGFGDPGGARH